MQICINLVIFLTLTFDYLQKKIKNKPKNLDSLDLTTSGIRVRLQGFYIFLEPFFIINFKLS